jgi:peptidyl-prolyl cis-trans isomerase A (cyclophilin A)
MRTVLPFLAAAMLALTAADAGAFPQSNHPAMTDPSKATDKAPDTFRAKFDTTKGAFVLECTRSWAPNGVDRFYNLVKIGFFDDIAFFRVAKGFVVQWGIHGDPKVSSAWQSANLPPDPVTQSNTRGMLTYAMAGRPDTRSTQLFINYKDNASLDQQGFAPICKVVEGMETVDALNGEYGERVTSKQGEIHARGNAYLREAWPNLDYIKTATIVGGGLSPSTTNPKTDSAGKPEENSTSILPFIVGGVVIAALIYFIMRRKNTNEEAPAGSKSSGEKRRDSEEKGEAPRKKKKKKASTEEKEPEKEKKKEKPKDEDEEDES